LRLLSALAGTAFVPVAYLAGARLVSVRGGLATAMLAALDPMLLYYGQEARAYALLILLAGLAFLAFAAILSAPGPPRTRLIVGWAAASALAIGTHYFAVFVVVPEALWLLARRRGDRRMQAAVGAVGATCLALLPLALEQRSRGYTSWIEGQGLGKRVSEVVKQFAVGLDGPAEVASAVISCGLIGVAAWLLVTRGTASERRGAWVGVQIGLFALVAPLIVAIAGPDFFNGRNVVGAWLPVAVAAGAGFGAARARRVGPAAFAVVSA